MTASFIWVPFGLRFCAPLSLEWLDASAGGGGLHENYSVSNPRLIMAAVHFVGEAAVSLDHRHHF
jgi:hypothetical protein